MQLRVPLARWGLLSELVRREFGASQRGTLGGGAWLLIQPLFLLAVYTFAFGVVLRARWGGEGDVETYGFMLFAGLIVFNLFAECFRSAPTLITDNPNFVKKVVFPLELLACVLAIASTGRAFISLCVWLVSYTLIVGFPTVSVLYAPLILLAFFPALFGVGWLFSALGTVTRDLKQIADLVAHAMLFVTPVFYSIDIIGGVHQSILLLNPLTFIVQQLRLVLLVGATPDLLGLAIYFASGVFFSAACYLFFRRLRPMFADLI
ncbi:MAG: ABC transporter permease [Gemmatimonadetes bacterium]|jgi:lipopolysaccharide transport system permease protein|nr:ABC transporter permease [Gemmatimonadota bacterium]MBT5143570.1 ABC transporter permease [Gemmatimonadota bacterium]MBT5873648.1 ABC transporter permease [Candidatus Latescibacterota bacterium]